MQVPARLRADVGVVVVVGGGGVMLVLMLMLVSMFLCLLSLTKTWL
jgi:hypothetical protein